MDSHTSGCRHTWKGRGGSVSRGGFRLTSRGSPPGEVLVLIMESMGLNLATPQQNPLARSFGALISPTVHTRIQICQPKRSCHLSLSAFGGFRLVVRWLHLPNLATSPLRLRRGREAPIPQALFLRGCAFPTLHWRERRMTFGLFAAPASSHNPSHMLAATGSESQTVMESSRRTQWPQASKGR